MLKRLLLITVALGSAAFADDLTFTLSPSVEGYLPGGSTALCQDSGTAPCVFYQGTLTDNNTDSSFMNVTGIAVSFDQIVANSYFTLDNTFYGDAPGLLVGDPNWAADGLPAPNSYSGPIFGLDFSNSTPFGVYTGTATIAGNGGTNDPTNAGFTVQQRFTVVISPEPSTALLMLLPLLAIPRFRRL